MFEKETQAFKEEPHSGALSLGVKAHHSGMLEIGLFWHLCPFP